MRTWNWWKWWWKGKQKQQSQLLHIGCGNEVFPGWINIDIKPLAGVDYVLNVTDGLPFSNIELIYAEHFIEHLDYDSGLRFLCECRKAMTDTGIIRLSTPNLDWVWLNQYHHGSWQDKSEAVRDCFWMNKAFHGWGHQFLYNRQTLTETLIEAGFQNVETVTYGSSRHPELCDLERHEADSDTEDIPHVVIVEAGGRTTTGSTAIAGPHADYLQAISST